MNTYVVYQIRFTQKDIDAVNASRQPEIDVPKFSIYKDRLLGTEIKEWKPSDFDYYVETMRIEAECFEDAYELGNYSPHSQVNRKHYARYISTGDIIKNFDTGDKFIVELMGFSEVSSTGAMDGTI